MDSVKHDQISKTYWELWNRVQSDPEYVLLRTELEKWEAQYETALEPLSEEARTVIETYITLRETMNRRMLEFACGGFVHLK